MNAEEMTAWVNRALNNGDLISDYYLSQLADDSFGWGHILENMWFAVPSARPSGTGLILTGPAGCGKHTAVLHMVQLLADNRYRFVFLTGDELGESSEAIEKIDSLLDRCFEDHTGLCLVLEDSARLPHIKGFYRYLGLTLCQFYLSRSEGSRSPGPKDNPRFSDEMLPVGDYEPFFLILLEEKEPSLPSLLRDRLQLCRMSLPDAKQRLAFFENHDLGRIRTENGLVDKTEGMSYGQLNDLLNNLRALTEDTSLDLRGEKLQEVLLQQDSLIASQFPPFDSRTERYRALTALAQAIETLPDLLARTSPPAASELTPPKSSSPDVFPQKPPANPEAFLSKRDNELRNLPLPDLIRVVFGEEDAALILKQKA